MALGSEDEQQLIVKKMKIWMIEDEDYGKELDCNLIKPGDSMFAQINNKIIKGH